MPPSPLLAKLIRIRHSFFLFLMTSGASVVVNLVLRYLFSKAFVFEFAIVLAYIGSTAVAYALARKFVFAADSDWRSELGRFALVNVVGLVQVVCVAAIVLRVALPLLRVDRHAEEIAHLVALGTLAFTSFYLHRRVSFPRGFTRR